MDSSRRLATVMFLDMVGYSRLMSHDEAAALRSVAELERIVREAVPAAGGRLVKLLGDGSLAEFPTAAAAMSCARAVLAKARPFQVRVGLHLGEITEREGDIFGDAVNIAARIQPLADPGGIAMSEVVQAQLRNHSALEGAWLPPRRLKNIPAPMPIFLLPPEPRPFAWALRRRLATRAPLAIALLAAVLAGAAAATMLFRSSQPVTVSMVHLRHDESPAAEQLAQQVQEEFDLLGPRLSGVRWVARIAVWEEFRRRGLGFEAVERGDADSCAALGAIGLRYPVLARLSRTASAWRLEGTVIDTENESVVATFESEGEEPRSLVSSSLGRLQSWVDALGSGGR
ncbi:MAG: adenylate/guanylate cyclase domain-containing protein [Myxococcales bacterium]|nr:adenylate/guanylate cyclase domain-containing protein [Myxococcales bacterium]